MWRNTIRCQTFAPRSDDCNPLCIPKPSIPPPALELRNAEAGGLPFLPRFRVAWRGGPVSMNEKAEPTQSPVPILPLALAEREGYELNNSSLKTL